MLTITHKISFSFLYHLDLLTYQASNLQTKYTQEKIQQNKITQFKAAKNDIIM